MDSQLPMQYFKKGSAPFIIFFKFSSGIRKTVTSNRQVAVNVLSGRSNKHFHTPITSPAFIFAAWTMVPSTSRVSPTTPDFKMNLSLFLSPYLNKTLPLLKLKFSNFDSNFDKSKVILNFIHEII